MATFFTNIIQESPFYNSLDCIDSLELLETTFRQKVQNIIADVAAHGRTLMVFET